MPDVAYGPLIAYDPTSNSLVPNASGVIYAVADTNLTTPLSLRDLTGLVVTEVRSSNIGVLDEFVVTDPDWQLEVLWVSGTYVIRLTSFKGLLDKVNQAAQAAQDAAAAASDAASAAAGSSSGLVLTGYTDPDDGTPYLKVGV